MGKVTGRAKGQRLYLSWSKICSRVEGGGGGGGQKLKSRLGPATGMALWGISGEEEKKVIVVSVNNADNIITHRIGNLFLLRVLLCTFSFSVGCIFRGCFCSSGEGSQGGREGWRRRRWSRKTTE